MARIRKTEVKEQLQILERDRIERNINNFFNQV